MMRISIVLVLAALGACSKDKKTETDKAGSGSAAAPTPADAPPAVDAAVTPDAAETVDNAAKFEAHAATSSTEFAACYEASMKSEAAKLKKVKSVDVRVTVGGAGKVDAVQYTGLPVGTKLEACLNKIIRAWTISGLEAGSYQLTLTPPA